MNVIFRVREGDQSVLESLFSGEQFRHQASKSHRQTVVIVMGLFISHGASPVVIAGARSGHLRVIRSWSVQIAH